MAASGVGGSTIIGVVIGGGVAAGAAAPAAAPAAARAFVGPVAANAAPAYGPHLTGGGGSLTTDGAVAGAQASSTLGSGALSQAEAAASNLLLTLPHTGANDVMVVAGCGIVALVAGVLCLGLARRRADELEASLAS